MSKMISFFFVLIVLFSILLSQSQANDSTIHKHIRNSEKYGELPVIDISTLLNNAGTNNEQGDDNIISKNEVIKKISDACRHEGFFYIVNHGVPIDLQQQLETSSATFFATETVENKEKIAMKHGGKSWRGYFSVGEEFTSGVPDSKEGLYFGSEDPIDDDRPLHGPNLWPESQIFRDSIRTYMEHMKNIGTVLMHAIIDSLDMPQGHPIDKEIFSDPTTLFRIFNYPPHDPVNHPKDAVGVGEHTDYGYLTILKQDQSGGLQMRLTDNSMDLELKLDKWIDVKYIENSFVINIGDALERMTHALYRATPHRVIQRANAKSSRLSFPYFFDPSFDAEMLDVGTFLSDADREHADQNQLHVNDRWDKQDPSQFYGTYGEYLSGKVAKVFPILAANLINKQSSLKYLNRPAYEDPNIHLQDINYDEDEYNKYEERNEYNEYEEL